VPQTNELVALQDEITREITRDAPSIALGVFGNAANHPDVVGLPNQRIDDIYRNAYLNNDRQFLQSEARRDPEQFLKVTDRLGVQMPAPGAPPPTPLSAQAAPTVAAPPPAPVSLPSVAPVPPVPPAPLPAPVPVSGPPPAGIGQAPPPVILGPNGQPLQYGAQ
jgi:hypothetical protein